MPFLFTVSCKKFHVIDVYEQQLPKSTIHMRGNPLATLWLTFALVTDIPFPLRLCMRNFTCVNCAT